MPTYSYRCTECETAFDIHQAFTDNSLTVCPNCGGKLRKLFSAVGVTFNGSGFYRNDSRPAQKSGASVGAGSGSTESKSGSGASGSGSSSAGKTSSGSSSGGSSSGSSSPASSTPATK